MSNVERTISRDEAEQAHLDMGVEARQRFMTGKQGLFSQIAANPKIVAIAFFAS
jgi:hypothetical protein